MPLFKRRSQSDNTPLASFTRLRRPQALLVIGLAALTGTAAVIQLFAATLRPPSPDINQTLTDINSQVCSRLEEFQRVEAVGQACRLPGGLFKVRLNNGETLLTHGPDRAESLAASSDETNADASDPVTPACVSTSDYHNYAIIATPANKTSRFSSIEGSIRDTIHRANGIIRNEGNKFGKTLNYKFRCSGSTVAIDNVKLGTSSADFGDVVNDLKNKGYNDTKAKYWIWFDGSGSAAGVGNVYSDDRPTVDNRANYGPSYGVTYGGTGDSGARIMAHENGHNLGAVQKSSPNSNGSNHCNDGQDVMCYQENASDVTGTYNGTTCGGSRNDHYDCNNNDYFNPRPPAGSYLANHWNIGASYNRYIAGLSGGTTTPPPPPPSDTTRPTTAITAPTNGATVSGTTIVSVNASDNIGVSKVEFLVDGALKATDTASPYSFAWDTKTTTNGSRALTTKAYDAAGNTTTSTAITVTVANTTVTPPPPPPPPPARAAVCAYYNATVTDHAYTRGCADSYGDYKKSGVAWYAYAAQAPGTVPVCSYYNASVKDNAYTAGCAGNYGDYKKTGVAFYAYRTQVTGTVPVCSYYNAKVTDNAYTRGCADAYGDYKKTRVEWYAFAGG